MNSRQRRKARRAGRAGRNCTLLLGDTVLGVFRPECVDFSARPLQTGEAVYYDEAMDLTEEQKEAMLLHASGYRPSSPHLSVTLVGKAVPQEVE